MTPSAPRAPPPRWFPFPDTFDRYAIHFPDKAIKRLTQHMWYLLEKAKRYFTSPTREEGFIVTIVRIVDLRLNHAAMEEG